MTAPSVPVQSDGPYLVTVKARIETALGTGPYAGAVLTGVVSRMAFARLRGDGLDAMPSVWGWLQRQPFAPEGGFQYAPKTRSSLPGSEGGAIGPLPDGTVIEVRPVEQLCVAFNAEQPAAAEHSA